MQISMSDIDVGFISRRAIHLRNLRESARKTKGAAGSHTSLEAYARKQGLAAGVRTAALTTVVGNGVAFAAVKVDGSVVTWGMADFGGDSRGVAEQLSSGVQTVAG